MCTCDNVLRVGGYELDAVPVLPRGGCGMCRGTGNAWVQGPGTGTWRTCGIGDRAGQTVVAKGHCVACGGTGIRGEILSEEHILVSADGKARPYAEPRESFEAAHHRHVCS